MNVKDATVVVTGGSDGYGFGIANVLITGRNESKLKTAAEQLKVRFLRADIASPADWDRAFEAAGAVDVLINNTGLVGR